MSDNKIKEEEKPIVAKTAVDLQRLKLVKLMKNIDKPIILPERPKAKNTPSVPEFVRNVMGSSAGAGSGEFHVYRHLRRKEYARQKFIQEKAQKELLDVEYHQKLEDNKRLAEETTAKKRVKRLKKKQNRKQKKQVKTIKGDNVIKRDDCKDSDSDSDENEEIKIKKINKINQKIEKTGINVHSCHEKTSIYEDKIKNKSNLISDEEKNKSEVFVKVSNENNQSKNVR